MALDLGAVLLALCVIVLGAGAVRWLFRRMHLPGVVGEILFGVALGPSLLGWVSPGARAALFPTSTASILEAIAWLGLVLFVFLVGVEMEWAAEHARPAMLVSIGGLLLPLAAGTGLALWKGEWFFAGQATWIGAAIVGIAVTVSALPVLARILEDLGRLREPLGVVAMTAATVDDIAGWILLAIVLAIGAGHAATGVWAALAIVSALATLALLGGRMLRHTVMPRLHIPIRVEWPLIATLGIVLGTAWLTNLAGLNAVLGPLAVGAAMSRLRGVRAQMRAWFGDLTRGLLLPVFFVVSGASVDFHSLGSASNLVALVVVLGVASLAKVAGCFAGGRAAKLPTRQALATGLLLNARGAVGLVVAKVGLDAKIFSVGGYTLLVLTVAFTTLVAPIASRWVLGDVQATPIEAQPEPT